MDYKIGAVMKVIPALGGERKHTWSAYLESPDGDVKLHYVTAILPDHAFADTQRPHPRPLEKGEMVAYIPIQDALGRLQAKAWMPLKW